MKRLHKLAFGTLASASLLAGCAQPVAQPTAYRPHQGKVQVLASVRVWAQIAAQLGGSAVLSTAVISNANQDPHSYETTVRDQLAVNLADITIANGGGYDHFFSQLIGRKPNPSKGMELNLFAAQYGKGTKSANPHIWYSPVMAGNAAKLIAAAETRALPNRATEITKNLARFESALSAMEVRTTKATRTNSGKTALLTENFAQPLIRALGITDKTPAAVYNAVEAGDDLSPKIMAKIQSQLAAGQFSIVILNTQTESAQTSRIANWARQAGIPVVAMAETLPEGTTYLRWMAANLNKIERAVK